MSCSVYDMQYYWGEGRFVQMLHCGFSPAMVLSSGACRVPVHTDARCGTTVFIAAELSHVLEKIL